MTFRLPHRISYSLLFLTLLAAPVWADTQDVSEIRVVGNDVLSRNAVLSYVKTRVGSPYDETLAKEDRNRLMGSGRFISVVVTRKKTDAGVIVTFRVKERAVVKSLTLTGNKAYPEEKLLPALPIAQGDPLDKSNVEAGRQTILNTYREGGYHFVKVTYDTDALNKKGEVHYKIVEGPRTTVDSVKLEGNHYFHSFEMKLRLDTKARFWPFINGELNNEGLDRDVTMIRNMYVQDGFLDCEVGRRLDFSDDKTKVTVVFLIHEGPRYRIRELIFKGNTVFSNEELELRTKFQKGAFYTTEVLRLDIGIIEKAYGEVGFVEAEVTTRKQFVDPKAPLPEWAANLDAGRPAMVNLVFRIKERDQYHVGAIRIKGNSITQSRVIRREMGFYPEQLVNEVAIERTKSRLQQMRLFDKVSITPVATDDIAIKDVLIDVTEGRTAEFMVGVGVSSDQGLLGTVSFTQRNFDLFAWPDKWSNLVKPTTFKGAGQTLNISAEPGTELMRFTISWFTPYLFDLPYSAGMKAYLFTRGYEHWDEERLGTQASLGHRFKNRWYGELATRIEQVQVNADRFRAAKEVLEDEGDHNLFGLRGSLTRDRTDSRWMPSTGDRLQFSYEQVVGTDTFGRFDASYKIYRTLYVDTLDRKHILAARVQLGQIVGDAPVFEKFYGGGIGSIRGFQYRGISPRGFSPGTRKTEDPVGGDTMFFAGTEYSFPLLTDKLRGVVFLDTGTVEEKFEISTYRISVGFGVRWTIPFFGPVPLALDFGFPISKDENDDTQVFSFSLGWTF